MNKEFTPNVILGTKPGDYIVGVNIDTPVIVNQSGNWLDYPAEHERQNIDFETSACTVFSFNDIRESLFMYLLHENKIPAGHTQWLKDNGYFKNGFINFDDRIPAMFAEINLGVGTYQYKAAEACRKWSLPQDFLPKAKTIQEWYDQSKITQEARDLQAEFDKRFKWIWFWNNNLEEGLKYSPVQSVVSFMNGEGVLCPTTPYNHAIACLAKKNLYVDIDDSYIQRFKKYCPERVSSYLGCKLIIIDDNTMDKSKFLKDNDTRQIRNKDNGAYGVIYGGQLLKVTAERAGLYMIDREARGLIQKLPTIQVTDADWNTLWRPSADQDGRYF